MPMTYQEFVEIRNKNPEEFNRKILPQMDLQAYDRLKAPATEQGEAARQPQRQAGM